MANAKTAQESYGRFRPSLAPDSKAKRIANRREPHGFGVDQQFEPRRHLTRLRGEDEDEHEFDTRAITEGYNSFLSLRNLRPSVQQFFATFRSRGSDAFRIT
jgi:hypothetical protein